MVSASRKIKINRAPVLTLWAAVVAERLGFDHDEALTFEGGKARSPAPELRLQPGPYVSRKISMARQVSPSSPLAVCPVAVDAEVLGADHERGPGVVRIGLEGLLGGQEVRV